jgi:hypothetical protein
LAVVSLLIDALAGELSRRLEDAKTLPRSGLIDATYIFRDRHLFEVRYTGAFFQVCRVGEVGRKR